MKNREPQSQSEIIRLLSACWLAAVLVSACAGGPERIQDSDPAPATAEETDQASPKTPAEPTDEEVMYRVFAAEYFGAEGDLEAAVGEYLEAALKSDDPAIARRATRVAGAGQGGPQASMAAREGSGGAFNAEHRGLCRRRIPDP
jgi:hypothetical protein